MTEEAGYRGYIATRAVRDGRIPQHVQNLVVRDYAERNGLQYLLSAVEYAMADCYMVLDTVLEELPQIDGIICYSLFMLPADAARRRAIYARVLEAGGSIHGAVENMAIRDEVDVAKIEDIFLVDRDAAKIAVG